MKTFVLPQLQLAEKVIVVPVVQVVQDSCAVVEETVEISQLSLLRNRCLPVVPVRLLTCPSVCNLLGRR